MKILFILSLLFTLPANVLFAQDVLADITLVSQQGIPAKSFGIGKKKKVFNPLSILYKGTLGLYQAQISPQWGTNCAFELSCSRFSREMVSEFGLVKGFFLSFDRMSRCSKISFFETLPIRINPQGKIIDIPEFYRVR